MPKIDKDWKCSEQVFAEREKAEREKAEREKAERWELSPKEKDIIRRLSRHGESTKP